MTAPDLWRRYFTLPLLSASWNGVAVTQQRAGDREQERSLGRQVDTSDHVCPTRRGGGGALRRRDPPPRPRRRRRGPRSKANAIRPTTTRDRVTEDTARCPGGRAETRV